MPKRWNEAMTLFEAALERPPGGRTAWLKDACDDPALRRAAEDLLAADARTDGILDQPLPAPPTDDPDASGRRVGSYRLVREIGRGGMGVVYLAERADGQFDQQVAVKLLRHGVEAGEAARRFQAERQILASLRHPNIAMLLDGGLTDDGQPYFVMEYAEGRPLDRHCDAEQLSVEERLRLFVTVGRAVQHAHQNLVVHRDLKPSNVSVTPGGQIKLLDFGIAKLLSEEARADGLHTRTGQHLMTPAYASPEQVRGDPVTTASDVYQLGLLLYELLTGRRPYNLADKSPSEIERVVCEAVPMRPSTAVTGRTDAPEAPAPEAIGHARRTELGRLQKKLSGDLDMIIMKALRKEPERRYASAKELADDLERHMSRQPVAARPDTLRYRARKFVRRHRVGVTAAALVLLSLLAGIAGTTWQARRASQKARRAEAERDKAQQVTAFLMELFKANDPGQAKGDTITARQLLRRGVERAEALKKQPGVQAQMFDVVGRVYQSLGRYDAAEPLLERALAMRRDHFGTEHLEVAESMNNLASLLHDRGAYEKAEPLYREALAVRRRLLGTEHSAVAESMNNLALVLLRKGDYDAAESLYRKSLAINRRMLGEKHLQLTPKLSGLATVLQAKRDYEAAEPLFREALTIMRRELGKAHPNVATALNNLGLLFTRMGKHGEAEPLLREALAMRRKLLGQEHPRVATSLNNLASLLHRKKDYEEAEPLFREALAINRKLLGEQHPRVAVGMGNLGELLRDKGAYEEAEPLLQGALMKLQTLLNKGHPSIERAANDLVKLYEAWGKPDQAAAYRTQRDPGGQKP